MLDETVRKLQAKLDDLWERQQLEKENTKLLTKYETESAMQSRLNELGDKVFGLESECKRLNHVREALMLQGDELKNRLAEQSAAIRQERKVMECEVNVLQSQVSELQDRVRMLLDENARVRSSL
jgi:FtsZ-binding cell division protein ZapB